MWALREPKMLSNDRISAVVAAADMDRAKEFYEKKLGMKLSSETIPNHLIFEGKGGTTLLIYNRSAPNKAEHTQVRFWSDDIEADVAELDKRGVVFEELDMGTIKTVNHIATTPIGKSAWLKDPDGNTLQVYQAPQD
jgi:catechol 2,3-dioxygenase-like lactoylglutathione lyase family enzyme